MSVYMSLIFALIGTVMSRRASVSIDPSEKYAYHWMGVYFYFVSTIFFLIWI